MQPSAWQGVQFAMATSARLNIPLLIAIFDSTPLGSPTKVWEAVSMTGKKPAGSTNQTMSFGGSAAGVVQQAGSNNTATATGTVSAGAPPEVLKALLAIQAELSQHPATKALTDAAVEQAKAAEPDKNAIGTQLKAALDVAKTTLGWAEIAGTIAPFVHTAAGWLGGDWGSQLIP